MSKEFKFQLLLLNGIFNGTLSGICTMYRQFGTYYIHNHHISALASEICKVTNWFAGGSSRCESSNLIHKFIRSNGKVTIEDCIELKIWKMILESDTEIQSLVGSIHSKGGDENEFDVTKILLDVDISKNTSFIKCYFMHSVWNIIVNMRNENEREIMIKKSREKIKTLKLPDKFAHLLTVDLSYYLNELIIPQLIDIVTDYYGLMDRELFIHNIQYCINL